MQSGVTKEFVQTLAKANGLDLPEERLEIVRSQYERYLETLERLETLNLPREAEPAITYVLPPDGMPPASQRRPGGQER